MEDRLVTINDVSSNKTKILPFSKLLEHQNIILLGDPGSGKSYLFDQFSAREEGRNLKARSFFNIPTNKLNTDIIYIDGLDEYRSGREDKTAIDSLVSKLFEVTPTKLRLSCREIDWHQESDLAALNDYFNESGGVVVAHLNQLTDSEILEILDNSGVDSPKDFLYQASMRDFDELLRNPLSLKMFIDVVPDGDWPDNRSDLYERSIDLMLGESSDKAPLSLNMEHCRDVAGYLSALRLIADFSGFSVAFSKQTPDICIITDIDRYSDQMCLAVLGTRLFNFDELVSTYDFIHRTFAEYLAAKWLAKQILSGLPLSRVLSLLGIDGHPVPAMRGLFAWLPCFLGDAGIPLVLADPYGVLAYGDAQSFSISMKRQLLLSLEQLSRENPAFNQSWLRNLGEVLICEPLVTEIERILLDESASFSIRHILMDGLSNAEPMPKLEKTLKQILADRSRSFAERIDSINALARLEGTEKFLADIYHQETSDDDDCFRLCQSLLSECYGATLFESDYVDLLFRCMYRTTSSNMLGGGLWHFDEILPPDDASYVLNSLCSREQTYENSDANLSNCFDAPTDVIDGIIIKALESKRSVTGEELWSWLSARSSRKDKGFSGGDEERLISFLRNNPEHLTKLIEPAIRLLYSQSQGRLDRIPSEIDYVTYGLISEEVLLEAYLSFFQDDSRSADWPIAYGSALAICSPNSDYGFRKFWELYSLAEGDVDLLREREKHIVGPIPDWRIRDRKTRLKRDKAFADTQSDDQSNFRKKLSVIRTGEDFGWVSFIARLYDCRFSDIKRDSTPRQRISDYLSEELAPYAIEALENFSKSGHYVDYQKVLDCARNNIKMNDWLPMLVGMDVIERKGDGYKLFSKNTLLYCLAISIFEKLHNQYGSKNRQKWKIFLLSEFPKDCSTIYYQLLDSQFSSFHKRPYISGLSDFTNEPMLVGYRADHACQLILSFPSMSIDHQIQLLMCVASEWGGEKLHAFVERAMAYAKLNGRRGSWFCWVAVGFILNIYPIPSFVNPESRKQLFWALRDIVDSSNGTIQVASKLSLSAFTESQLYELIKFSALEFSYAERPDGKTGGSRNPWNASQFIESLLSQLASRATELAGEFLIQLLGCQSLSSFEYYIRKAIAENREQLRERNYSKPSFIQVKSTLENGPPANAADLQALVLAHLKDIQAEISGSNADIYKQFWNEDKYGRPDKEKTEESCRDVLIQLLRVRLGCEYAVEPEVHARKEKRVDFVVYFQGIKLVVELKRQMHTDLWTAPEEQLQRLYTIDPAADGYGLYGVFWFDDAKKTVPKPSTKVKASTDSELKKLLEEIMPGRIKSFVLRVSA